MSSVFTKIISDEIPSHKIAETDEFLAFLDAFPCAPGHTLVIPKKEVDYIFDLDDDLFIGLMKFAKSLEPAIKAAVPCKRVGVAVIGLEVPHAHVHLIPMNSMSDMNFNKKLSPTHEDLAKIADKIKAEIES
jgi:histidine triad (HIT) family protein